LIVSPLLVVSFIFLGSTKSGENQPEMCQKCDLFQAFLGASLIYLSERVAGSDEKEKWRRKKSSFQCYTTFSERTDSLKALDSVAIYLEDGNFLVDK
jgi:hypothetical protein